jgi:hypothetical protein
MQKFVRFRSEIHGSATVNPGKTNSMFIGNMWQVMAKMTRSDQSYRTYREYSEGKTNISDVKVCTWS